jgi:phthiocerol/phenolphthiocerol synthesis type-I polyketide synthase C
MTNARPLATRTQLAVVGYAFRFPGPGGDDFWRALREGRHLVGSVDASRWAPEAFYHPRESEPGASYTRAAGTLGDVSGFDAAFFGISPREAAQMDPQQRMLLELAWEALEAGGIPPSSIRGSRCSVVVGFSGSDYGYRGAEDVAAIDAFSMTGINGSIAANRISYAFDLRGPSMAVDTACSSSLVAFHQACQAILSQDADLAIVGAVNLHLHPLAYVAFSKASMLSKQGACRAFDADGDGYVRSEGGAIVVVKPLDKALADGNRIFALVAGSGLNCDGRTNGLTVPSAEAQAALLSAVYERAGIKPADIDYIEAHGTGTAVGDPIEARALGQEQPRPPRIRRRDGGASEGAAVPASPLPAAVAAFRDA